jgi:hypothetical protein
MKLSDKEREDSRLETAESKESEREFQSRKAARGGMVWQRHSLSLGRLPVAHSMS